ncbi:MAG: hypothetical protein DMD78_07945 [Candidatus Rokuibacteriota bacterium]|nr:MAG: hypothetical protein DMD78_07945 [Candidatus Rokubacteria bacterium]
MEAMIALLVLLVVVGPLAALVLSLTLRRRVRELELRLLLLENERTERTRATARAPEPVRPPSTTEPAQPIPVESRTVQPTARLQEPADATPVQHATRLREPADPTPVPHATRLREPADPTPVHATRLQEPADATPVQHATRLQEPADATPVQHATRTGGSGGSGTRPPAQWSNLEQRLGGTWLNRVGALVLTLGIAFFLKYAFDNQWIQPAGRVALGLVAGALLLLVGERLQRAAYRGPAQGVVAVGIAALYLSVYAAFAFYQLVTQPVAFAVMVLVTATAAALALHHDARAVAVLANLGGFLTPILLATDRDAGTALFGYLAVLDAGMLVVAWHRRWPELGLMSFAFTHALYVAWFQRWYTTTPSQQGVALVAAGVFLVLFSLVAPTEALSRRLPPRPEHLWRGPALIALAAPVAAFVAAREVLHPAHVTWLAVACLVLAAYYLGLAQSTAKAPGVGPLLVMLHGAVSLAFLTLTFPVQFAEHGVAIAWSVEGAAIVWGGFRLDARPLRLGGLVVLALAAVRWMTLFGERTAHRGVFVLDHPAWSATVAFVAASALAALAYHANGRGRREREQFAGPALALAAVLSATIFLHVELERHVALGLERPTQALIATLLWLAAATLTLGLAGADRTQVLLGAATLLLLFVGLGAINGDLERWRAARATLTPLANFRFVVGLLIVGVYALYARLVRTLGLPAATEQPLRTAATAGAALFLLWHLSMEIVLLPLESVAPGDVTMAHHMGLSILWTLYAFVAMGIGLQRQHGALRFGAIGLFALTVVKVFLVDLGRLDAGYRILSFVVLGGLLILASFLYTRYRERLAGSGS